MGLAGVQLQPQLLRRFGHVARVHAVDAKALHQPQHAGGVDVADLLIVHQAIQHPQAQRALGHLHAFQAQQVEHGAQYRQAAGHHGAAVFLQAFQLDAVQVLGTQQLLLQPVQPGAGDDALALAIRGQGFAHRVGRAGGGVGHVPAAGAEGVQGLVQHGTGSDFGRLEGFGRDRAGGEVARGPCHAADAVGGHGLGHAALTEHEFGGAPADVDHQAAFVRGRQLADHAAVDQRGFFLTGDDFDRKAQQFAALVDEFIAVAGFPQGLRGHGAHALRVEPPQAFAKARQAGPAALHGLLRQVAIAVQAIALAHGFLQVLQAVDLEVFVAADFQAETVGAKIYGGKCNRVVHEGDVSWRRKGCSLAAMKGGTKGVETCPSMQQGWHARARM